MSATTAGWAAQRERGSAAWLGAMRWAVTALGTPVGHALLLPIVAWFLLTSPAARAASRGYLGRVFGRPARLWDVAWHFHTFARSILDRALLLMGRIDPALVTVEGIAEVEAALAQGRGCLLMGAHLGGFEALRLVGRRAPARVRPMMFRRNSGALTALMDRLDPSLLADVIELGGPCAMLEAQEAVRRGELVGVLADRAPGGSERHWVQAPFLGSPAPFPAGPFALAHALGAPVLLFRAVRTGRRWLVQFEPFADRVVLRRGPDRAADLQALVGAYAAALERVCRAHPFEWFNFYPFWEPQADANSLRDARPASPGRDAPAGVPPGAAPGRV